MSVRHERSRPVDRRVHVQGRPVDSYPALPPETERGSVRRVTVVGEEILSRPCQEVTEFGSPELSALDPPANGSLEASGVGAAVPAVAARRASNEHA
ncbi:hypothetical protein ACGFU7_26870, partial [Streptomyces sp. NPDC048473]